MIYALTTSKQARSKFVVGGVGAMKTGRLRGSVWGTSPLLLSVSLLCLVGWSSGVGLGVISIDLGSQFLKVALVKVGLAGASVRLQHRGASMG